MALRPPRRGVSVSRAMSERARAAREAAPAGPVEIPGFGGITGMIGALRGMMEQLSEAARDATAEDADGSGKTCAVGGRNARMVFGYTLKMGPEGVSAEPFGNVPPHGGAKAAAAEPVPMQPIVEVFQDGETVVVIAELPGAEPARVVCRPEGTRLLIEAGGSRSYRKEVALPVPVRADGMQQTVQNGILEVRLAREARA